MTTDTRQRLSTEAHFCTLLAQVFKKYMINRGSYMSDSILF